MTPRALALNAQTAWRLGPLNIARVAAYKAQLRLGRGVAAIVPPPAPTGTFFDAPATVGGCPNVPLAEAQHFGWIDPPRRADGRPDWFANVLSGQRATRTDVPWYQLGDFDPAVGDIKGIWEWSRFDWVVRGAQQMRATGDLAHRTQLNEWLADWLTHNPPYQGPNWKCGQEASIRVLHLVLANHIIGARAATTSPLADLVRLHLARIAPTTSYAVAQDNNHGTSEGAALFVGGIWLASLAPDDHAARTYVDQGRRLLEDRTSRLFMTDGSFAQYSVNYHRMALDALMLSEWARRSFGGAPFSELFQARAAAATRWLAAMVDPETGAVPLLGANDGARLAPLTGAYSDYRPSLARAAAVFLDAGVLAPGPHDDDARWLGLDVPRHSELARTSQWFDDGGFAVLRQGAASVYIRYPRFRFRPSQSDLLHVDLWLGADNVLPDGGTYSYNTDAASLAYFGGPASHNTVQFDDRDQMPRLSRFLYGGWLDARDVAFDATSDGAPTFRAAYRDGHGATHVRAVALGATRLIVTDTIAGFRNKAVLRWRLGAGKATLDGRTVRLVQVDGRWLEITVEAASGVRRIELVHGAISTHYGRRTPIDVFEVELDQSTSLTSTITWNAR